MPRPALNEAQRREIRQRIRDAAAQLYAADGLGSISARAIAEQAGVSVGTIYSHFKNLPELMQSLWREPVRRLVSDLENAAAAQQEPLARLRGLLELYAAFAIKHQAVYRGAFMFVRPEAHDKPHAVPVAEAGIGKVFVAAIRDGQEQGVVRPGDPVTLAELLWAGLHGAQSLPVNVDRVAFSPPQVLTPHMVDLLLEWVAA